MWFEESVFYQIYPLGFCGAPFENAPAQYDEQGIKLTIQKRATTTSCDATLSDEGEASTVPDAPTTGSRIFRK